MKNALVLIVVALLVNGCGIDRSDPAAVAEAYVDAVYYANVPLFMETVAKEDYEANDDHKYFYNKDSTGKNATREKRGGITVLEVAEPYINDRRATVRIHVEFVNGDRRDIRISLFKDNGEWFVRPMSWANW